MLLRAATKGVTQAMEHKIYETELAGRKLSFEFGRYAEQAAGSVLVRYGDTVVLVCATVAETPRPGIDFFPLGVDFEEKLYSVGKIPGGFIKREDVRRRRAHPDLPFDRPPAAPALPQGRRNDVNVVATVLSNDNDCSPEIPAMLGFLHRPVRVGDPLCRAHGLGRRGPCGRGARAQPHGPPSARRATCT